MSPARRLAQALRNLFHSDRLERDLDDEIRAYVEMTADDLHARGLPGGEARRQALVDLGGIDQVKEEVRGFPRGRTAGPDETGRTACAANAARRGGSRRSPSRRWPAVSAPRRRSSVCSIPRCSARCPTPTLGGSTSFTRSFPRLLASLPLVPVNALHFQEWRAATSSFDELALHRARCPTRWPARATPYWSAPRVRRPISFGFWGSSRCSVARFTRMRTLPGRDDVVILSHELWATQFGADPAVIGRTVRLDGSPQVVVGVMPEGFDLAPLNQFYEIPVDLGRPRLWKPFAARPRDLRPLGSFNYIALDG